MLGKAKTSLLLSYISIASLSAAIITPALGQIEQSMKLTHGQLEWVVSIFMLGYVIGQLIYGPLANRYGCLSALRLGLIINLVGIIISLLGAYGSTYSILLLGRFVTALGAASGLACTIMLLRSSLSEEKVKKALSFAMVSFTLGIGFSVCLGGLVAEYFNWQDCFWVLLMHGLVMYGCTFLFQEASYEKRTIHPLDICNQYLCALQSGRLLVFSLAVGLVSAVAYGYSTMAPIYAESVLNLTPSTYAYWNLINMLGMLISGFLANYLIQRVSAKSLLLIGCILMLPSLLSLSYIAIIKSDNTLLFFITTSSLYLFSGLLFPAGSHLALDGLRDRASGSSMMSFINMASATLAVVLMGYSPLNSIETLAIMLVTFYSLAMFLMLIID